MATNLISPLAQSNVTDPVVILVIALGVAGLAILVLFNEGKI